MDRICGRAALYNGEYARAEEEYRQATALNESALPAWEGMALLQQATGDVVEAAETLEKMVWLHTLSCIGNLLFAKCLLGILKEPVFYPAQSC